MHTILITGALHESALEAFKQRKDLKINYLPDCKRPDLLNNLKNVHVLLTRSETDVDKEIIDNSPDLKVIARAAVGVGNIDIPYATEKGILVVNCPAKNTNSAAELTFALMLSMLRNIAQAHQHLKNGGWDRHKFSGRELRGKTIGIVGLGNVGHRVAKFARGFDMDVYAYDPYIAPEIFERHNALKVDSLLEMAKTVDILSVHVPLNKETKGMITKEVIQAMKPGSYFVNAARGGIVPEDILLQALNRGHIAGAAIDTWESEPKPLPELLNHPHVWCSPHIGASTLEAQIAVGETIVQQVLKAIDGHVVDHPVNMPHVTALDSPLIQSYGTLCEKLGSFLGQTLTTNPAKFEIYYRGDLAKFDHGVMRLALMKGYASQISNDYISFVNVEKHFQKLGIHVKDCNDPSFTSYKSALKVVVHTDKQHPISVGGIVFDDRYPRLTLIKDFYFEIEPQGHLIVIENHDRPGVIGNVGHFFSSRGINIESFDLSRNRKGGSAMAIIKVDAAVEQKDIADLQKVTNIINAKYVRL